MKLLFADIELGSRVESTDSGLLRDIAGAISETQQDPAPYCQAIAGGVASWVGPDSPFNKVASLGFSGPLELDQLQEVEQAFLERSCPIQVELSTLGDPAIGTLLTQSGYQLQGFEDVLGCPLQATSFALPKGVQIRESPQEELDLWIETVAEGFASPDDMGVPSQDDFPTEALHRAMRQLQCGERSQRFLAYVDDEIAGGGGLYCRKGVALFTGASTLPRFRRRGVQTALLDTRLALALEAGCDLGVVTTQPGSKSQQNVQRKGFQRLYSRAILLKTST